MLEHPYSTRSKSRFLRSVEKLPEEDSTLVAAELGSHTMSTNGNHFKIGENFTCWLEYSLLILRDVPEKSKSAKLLELLGPTAFRVAFEAGARADQDIDTVVETLKRTFNPRRQTPLDPEAFFRRRQKPSEDPAVYLHELRQTARETFDYLRSTWTRWSSGSSVVAYDHTRQASRYCGSPTPPPTRHSPEPSTPFTSKANEARQSQPCEH